MINKPKYSLIDTHVHYTDFTWNSNGLNELIHYMNKNNIAKSVVFWLPVKKIWNENEKFKPNYYLDDDSACHYDWTQDFKLAVDYINLNKMDQDRIMPLLCSFNPMDWNSIDYIKYMLNSFPWVFAWIWEVFYRHDDLTFQTVWETPRMNNRFTNDILELCSLYNLPFLVHNNITSRWNNTYPKFLDEFESMVREYPKTKIILAHAWISRGVKIHWYIKILKRLLTEYSNLYLDLSWVIFDDVIAFNDETIQEWCDFIEIFNKRFIIWSDILGDEFFKIWEINAKYNEFLSLLSEKTLLNITYNNSESIYNKKISKPLTFPNIFNNEYIEKN